MKRIAIWACALLFIAPIAYGQQNSNIHQKIDWMNNYLDFEVTSPRDPEANDAQAYLTAMVHGQVLAYAELQTQIGEFAVMSRITGGQRRVKDYMQVGTSASDINYPGLTLKEIREERLRDGTRQYVLIYETPLAGKGSLLSLVQREIRQEEEEKPTEPFPVPESPPVESDPDYTGLVIDLRGKKVTPAPVIKILSESKQEVYGILKVPAEYVQKHGLVGYARTIDQPKSIRTRIGDNPLILSGEDVVDVIGGNPIVSNDAAERIVTADQKTGFLSKSRVAFLLGN